MSPSSTGAPRVHESDEGVVVEGKQTISIDNQPVEVEHQRVPVGSLKLDSDNPRLRYLIRKLPHTPTTAELANMLLDQMDFADDLFKQIRDNGGIHDPVHVLHDDVVVEGNTRVACLLRLAQKQPGDPRWKRVPILRLPKSITPKQVAILQGNFHVQAKNKWKAYAKAEHLHYMHKTLRMPLGDIAKALGMQERIVERLIGQYEMMTSEVLPNVDIDRGIRLWSHVDEFFKREDLAAFREKKASRKQFAQFLVDGKIKKGADVRKLGKVVCNPRALEELAKNGLDSAVRVVTKSDPTIDSPAFKKVVDATNALRHLPRSDLERLRTEKKVQDLLRDLQRVLDDAASIAKFQLR
jgi:hypothetical protein